MKNMIGIRADANEDIAMGHVMRCLSIAVQLKDMGVSVLFILSDAYARQLILDAGFPCEVLNNDYKEKDAELPQLSRLCKTYNLKSILIDSYQVTPSYLKHIHQIMSVAYIDDLGAFRYDADIIINYSQGSERPYAQQRYMNTKFLLGRSYTPLRPEFAEGACRIKPDVNALFITSGGTDPYDMVLRLLTHLKTSPLCGCTKHIVLGKFYHRIDTLHQWQEQDTSLYIYQDIPHIREIMMQCDLAVSAGGTTLCELAACGIPTVAFTMADNQQISTSQFADAGGIIYVGDVRGKEETSAQDITSALVSLAQNPEKRCELAATFHAMIDGIGAKRIAQALSQFFSL